MESVILTATAILSAVLVALIAVVLHDDRRNATDDPSAGERWEIKGGREQ